MAKTVTLIIFSLVLFSACNSNDSAKNPTDELNRAEDTDTLKPITGKYDYVIFRRDGGGNLIFNIYPPPEKMSICQIKVTRVQFRDTSFEYSLGTTGAGFPYAVINEICSANRRINSYFEPKPDPADTLPTGTWVNYFAATKSDTIPITNQELIDELSRLNFEETVRRNLSQR